MANLQPPIIWTGDAMVDALGDVLTTPLRAELQQKLAVSGVS